LCLEDDATLPHVVTLSGNIGNACNSKRVLFSSEEIAESHVTSKRSEEKILIEHLGAGMCENTQILCAK
jgi:hypothetical protein